MKNKILIMALLLSLSTATVMAQQFKIGPKLGTDIHKIDGSAFNDQFSYGYHLGGFAEIGLSKKFGIQPEVLFSQVNVDTSDQFSDIYEFNSVSNIKLKYLKIPVLLNYNPNPFVSLQVGPQFGILMDQDKTLLKNGSAAFSNGDFSMLGGMQLNISKLKIYGRYAIGLSNINDIDDKEKWNNQTIQLGIGFAL